MYYLVDLCVTKMYDNMYNYRPKASASPTKELLMPFNSTILAYQFVMYLQSVVKPVPFFKIQIHSSA